MKNGQSLVCFYVELLFVEEHTHPLWQDGATVWRNTHPLWQDGAAVWGRITHPLWQDGAAVWGTKKKHPSTLAGWRWEHILTQPCPRVVRERRCLAISLLKGYASVPHDVGQPGRRPDDKLG